MTDSNTGESATIKSRWLERKTVSSWGGFFYAKRRPTFIRVIEVEGTEQPEPSAPKATLTRVADDASLHDWREEQE